MTAPVWVATSGPAAVVGAGVDRVDAPLKVTGAARYTIDTSAVNTFIHDNMIDARRSRDGLTSNDVWKLTRNTRAVSLPRLFAELRAGLRFVVRSHLLLSMVLVATIGNALDKPLTSVVAPLRAGLSAGVTTLGLPSGSS